LDYGRTAYRPPADLVEFVLTRDRTCRFPTCNRPARHCDIDHAHPWEAGGTTSARNCGALCRSDHRQKTAGNTQLDPHPDGSATWTTASGHTYHQPAVDHCPEHTARIKATRESAPERPDPWDPDASFATDNEEAAATDSVQDPVTDRTAAATVTEPDPDTSSGNDPPPF
ncbi:MAG: HNH endonuclease signature motif containing protein, partial [Actinomycetota bacterium]